MAELDQIVGAVLRDIAQARFASDIHSREISRYYEQDALLRRFPVPRSEVDEVELDLKFVISAVRVDGDVQHEVTTATVFTKFSFDIAARVFDQLLAESGDDEDLTRLLKRTSSRITLQQELLLYFERNQGHLIQEGQLNTEDAERSLRPRILAFLKELLEIKEMPEKLPVLQSIVESSLALGEQVKQLAAAIDAAIANRGDCRLDVGVTSDVLSQAPATTVSSLKVTARVRNYIWSQVGEKDGKIRRALSPE